MAVTILDAVPIARVGAMLGEGPVWVKRDAALWYVDIKAPCVYRLDVGSGDVQCWPAPDQVGWVLPSEDGGFLAGVRGGLHHFSPADGRFVPYHPVEVEVPGNRLNDAAVDAAGRLWFGSMDDGEAGATGRLYVHDRGVVTDSGADPVVITNGPAIDPDGRILYAVDTLGRSIDAYALDEGRLGARRRFLTVDPRTGYPDGITCDADGGVWVGFFGGWAAHRYAPDGTQTHVVRFPTANITKIAIGGPDGRTAYATTARLGLDAATLAGQPLAGDVFAFPVETPGVATSLIALA